MLRYLGLILISCLFWSCSNNSEPDDPQSSQPSIMLLGASIAHSSNGWFEMGCASLNMRGINKAKNAEAIFDSARRMYRGTAYTFREFENTELLVIMHVHNEDVFCRDEILPNLDDYKITYEYEDYAGAFDYVIRKYKSDCESLEFNPASKYYNVQGGKPAKIMLCTFWHDSREKYNQSVRRLAEYWDIPLIEFDTNIGFSKNDEGLSDPGEPSRAVAINFEKINGVEYGWHPLKGFDEPIQQKMAEIFVDAVCSNL